MTDTDWRPVVAGVDGSRSALHAVRWAGQEAARRAVSLRLVHVTPAPDHHAMALDQGRRWLAAAAKAARQVAPDIAVAFRPRHGRPADVLVAESRTARLVVVGSHGFGGFAALLGGPVAVTLSASSHCPVVVVQPSAAADAPVVVGIGGSDLSDAAVTFAFETAAARAVPLVAVHRWQDVETRVAEDRLAAWRARFPQVEVRMVVERTRALLSQASGARLMVVGSRGRRSRTGFGMVPVPVTAAGTESR